MQDLIKFQAHNVSEKIDQDLSVANASRESNLRAKIQGYQQGNNGRALGSQ